MIEIMADAGKDKHSQKMILCRCSCGKVFKTRLSSVKSGLTTSCGCIRRKKQSEGMKKFWQNIR